MGLKDIFNISKILKENHRLKNLIATLTAKIAEMEVKYENLQKNYSRLEQNIEKLKKDAIVFEDAIIFQEFGLYTPRYDFIAAEDYKLALEKIRTQQT